MLVWGRHRHGRGGDANGIALDWLNILLADVEGGLGPFLAVLLMSSRHWDPARIGLVLTIGGVTTVLARAPGGALVDGVRWKRSLIAVGALAVALAAGAIALVPAFWVVVVAQVASGTANAIFPSAVAAISLGIFGRAAFARRVGRNEAFNHLGNVATALAGGAAGYLIGPAAVLWLVGALALASVAAVYALRGDAIDHTVARGADDGDPSAPRGVGGLAAILENRALLAFTAAITLFHFANAAMLPLVGEKLAMGNGPAGSLLMGACIVAAQVVMVPMALLVGAKADDWGRKAIFLVGFAALPVRGLLFAVTDSRDALIAIQLLDGVGAGIFGALFFVVVADLTEGTGRYNLALGAAGACWGLGAALSNAVAGWIAGAFGFSAAFLVLTACALAALGLFWLAVPETRGIAHRRAPGLLDCSVAEP